MGGLAKVRVLVIDLGAGSVEVEELETGSLLGLGGKALGLKLLELHLDPQVDALSPANVAALCPSPLADFAFPGSNRLAAFTKSPLTGAWLESYVGGSVSRHLAETGWNAVLLRGVSSDLVSIAIDREGAVIRDASALRGLDCFDAEAGLLRGAPSRSSALVIGPAGEARTVVASVMHEGAHALGRGGLGAVFGSKGIKGILVSSPGPRKLPSSRSFSSTRLEVSGLAAEAPAAKNYQRFGTPMMVAIMNEAGAFPSDFFSAGRSPHRASLEAEGWEEWAEVLHDACAPCPMRCRKRLRLRGGESAGKVVHGPEYETLYAFGGSCGVAEARDVAILNERCNRLGLDTMSAGNLVGLAIKAREAAELEGGTRGPLSGAPRKGEVGAIEALLEAMAKRSTELGDILARGMNAAAAVLGVEDLVITSKGLEPAGYEPRKMRGMALSYALSPRGACHLRTTFYKAELAGLVKDLDDEAFVATLVDWEDRLFFADSLVVCRFFRDFLTWERVSVCVSELAGRTVEVPELRDFSRDILTRIRRLNEAMGLGPEDDDLAPRFFLEGTDSAPPLDRGEFESRRRIYWESRGWGSEGRCPAPASKQRRREETT